MIDVHALLERSIATQCQHIWGESPQNHVCGLLEEAVEVAHASGELTQEQCLEVLTACVRRVYERSVPDSNSRPRELYDELCDLTVMASCVRMQTQYMEQQPLLVHAYCKISQLTGDYLSQPEKFRAKTQAKHATGIRLPTLTQYLEDKP